MPIPEPFTVATLSAGIVSNIATDILEHHARTLEGALVGRLLKGASLIEPDFNDCLHNIVKEALGLFGSATYLKWKKKQQ